MGPTLWSLSNQFSEGTPAFLAAYPGDRRSSMTKIWHLTLTVTAMAEGNSAMSASSFMQRHPTHFAAYISSVDAAV